MQNNPDFQNHNKFGILTSLTLVGRARLSSLLSVLTCVSLRYQQAQVDPDAPDSLKGSDIVSVIAHAMERHSKDAALVEIGKQALMVLADQQVKGCACASAGD